MAQRVSAAMQAPRGGWLVAASGSLLVLLLASALSPGPLDTLSIDLRHRAVALTAPRPPADATPAGRPRPPSSGFRSVGRSSTGRASLTNRDMELPYSPVHMNVSKSHKQ